MDTEQTTVEVPPANDTNVKLVVELVEPLDFEGERVERIDLNGLLSLKGRDMKKANRLATGEGINPALGVISDEYCIIIAHLVSGHPLELFDELSARDYLDVTLVVKNFLLDTGWIETR